MTDLYFLAFSHQYWHNFSFQSLWLLFPYASEVTAKNSPQRKFTPTVYQTCNIQVRGQIHYFWATHLGFGKGENNTGKRECAGLEKFKKKNGEKEKIQHFAAFYIFFFHNVTKSFFPNGLENTELLGNRLHVLTFHQIKKKLAQTESICRRQNNCDSKIEIWIGKDIKHFWKRRKCWLPALSPFPTMFSKDLFLWGW